MVWYGSSCWSWCQFLLFRVSERVAVVYRIRGQESDHLYFSHAGFFFLLLRHVRRFGIVMMG